MNLAAADLDRLALSTGFRSDTLEKVIRLGEVVDSIARHAFLSRVLALKGGTALNLFFGPPRRLSVDLDFNYVGRVDREGMLEERGEVERAIDRIGEAHGYRIQLSAAEHAGGKRFFQYRNHRGSQDRIEVDLNFLYRVPLGRLCRRTMWQPKGIDRPAKLQVVSIEELCAGKICALLARVAPRDLFDVAGFPSAARMALRRPRFRGLFVAFAGGALTHPLHTYKRSRIDRVTKRQIETELVPMIRGDAPSLRKLREETWNVVKPLLALEAAEREFTHRLKKGELKPEILFPRDGKTAAALAKHPLLLWKAANARSHRERRV
jgi:predicted nucleotidyltransferase component of viral defense system